MPRFPEPEPLDQDLVGLLHRRSGTETIVELDGGRMCRVLNIAWGYDAGDSYAHITTNISPSVPGLETDFFFTAEVIAVLDAVASVEPGHANSGTLPRDSVRRLLEELCRNFGFCLPPEEQARLRSDPPNTPGAFTAAVFIAEGLDPALADTKLWKSVHGRVVRAFDGRI